MSRGLRNAPRWIATALGLALVLMVALPVVALGIASAPADLVAGARDPLFVPALWLSVRTTLVSLLIIVVTGTPLAWWIATGPRARTRIVEVFVVMPIVLPPAVLGVALLEAFGRHGLLGPLLEQLDVQIPFTSSAVVIAQVVVSAPFYVEAAAIAFRRVDVDLMLVARTLGASAAKAFFRVAIPVAATGLLGGAALAYARAIGEFGATLLFAGNLTGVTQTMPLAIYMALESDVRAALALSWVLAAIAIALLFAIRVAPQGLSGGARARLGGRRPR
ncbi:MAG: molybdate ABC transporter permease subunit [Myxococcota bacterium]